MQENKEDRSILIMILAIFIACFIALIALGNIIWRIISPSVNTVVTEVSNVIRINRLDYNFPIPPKRENSTPVSEKNKEEDSLSEEQKSVIALDLNYNFPFNAYNSNTNLVLGSDNFYEEIFYDNIFGYQRQSSESKEGYIVKIPKIELESPVYRDNNINSLKFGMWMHKSSFNYNEGEMVFLCSRRYFSNNDPRSCYFMNNLNLEDEIYLKVGTEDVKFIVTKLEYISDNYQDLYNNIASNNKQLRIITTGTTDIGKGRLVITALKN